MENSIEKLTAIQKEVGYETGEINNIALLGLFGEAGEVINECAFSMKGGQSFNGEGDLLHDAVITSEKVDALKKRIRDKQKEPMNITIKDDVKFDSE